AWLEQAFGFECHAVYEGPDGTVAHAELRFGNGMVMVGSASNKSPLKHLYVSPVEIGGRVTSPLYLIVEDCEPAYARALAAKAEIVMDMKSMEYGGKRSRSGILKDTFGPWASIPHGPRKKPSPT